MSITAPTATVASGTALTLSAQLSPDLVTAVQAGTPRGCYFTVGDDANSVAVGTLNTTAGTCQAAWTYNYAATYTLTATVTTPARIAYTSPPVTITITGPSNPRCTASAGAPATCVYRWTEVYYTNTGRSQRVCSIDGACQWQTSHTSWNQITGKDYWTLSTGQTLPDGDNADAYLCLGSAPSTWSTYANDHNFDTLLAAPQTTATPLPAGTC